LIVLVGNSIGSVAFRPAVNLRASSGRAIVVFGALDDDVGYSELILGLAAILQKYLQPFRFVIVGAYSRGISILDLDEFMSRQRVLI
jgi:hypothetical protein